MFRLANLTLLSLLLFAVLCRSELDAWHADIIGRLGDEQLDPIISPNSVSSHMHTIIGGSAFGASYNYDTYANAQCSTIQIQADKSNYWVPQLYLYDPTFGSKPFISIKSSFRFYYFLSRNSAPEPVSAFPKGLRILAGNPNTKTPEAFIQYTCQVNRDLSKGLVSKSFNFASNCPYGMVASLHFPRCWDGINLWLPGSAHMSQTSGNNMRHSPCPMSHPVRLPLIMMEITWTPEAVAPGVAMNGKLVFANGDMTGYGLHGDFVNGWDVELLDKALNTQGCIGTDTEIAIEECSVFGRGSPHYSPSAAAACKPELGLLQEPFGNEQQVSYANLPGANAPPGVATPSPPAQNVAPFTGTDGAYQVPAGEERNFVWPTKPEWTSLGCVREKGMIQNATNFFDTKLTPERCQAACGSSFKPVAAIGFDFYNQAVCTCGSSISLQTPVAPLMCNVTCPGDASSTCGGSDRYEIFFAPTGTPTAAANSTISTTLGCLTNTADGLLTRATYTFKSSSLTTEVCLQACVDRNATWALTTNSQSCACGTNYALGKDTYVPSDFCTSKCGGNATQFCGSAFRSSVYNLTAVGLAPIDYDHPVGYQGCFEKPRSGLALSDASWSTDTMTISGCIDDCSSLGKAYAAVSDGRTCMCGQKPQVGGLLPASQCASPCAGNTTSTCGGGLSVELYSTNNSAITPETTASRYTADWSGCYTDSADKPALSDYSFSSSSMTPSMCKSGCLAFDYGYAGLKSGNTCNCGKTPPATMLVAASLCSSRCSGNSSLTCGAGFYSDTYNVTAQIGGSGNGTESGSGALGYKGCYQDTPARGLNDYTWTNGKMTIDMCRTGCSYLNYTLAGLQNGNQCFCGNTWKAGSVLPDLSCSQRCSGNSTQFCGAAWISSLYSTTTAPSYPARPAGWQGCYTDPSTKRALSAYTYKGGMTIDVCRATCLSKGYKLAGVENGNECYCDNTIQGPALAPVTLCTTPCSLNSTSICGGPGNIDIYLAAISGNGTGVGASDKPGHLGCYKDWGPSTLYDFQSDMLTPGQCNQVCIAKGYKFSSIRNGNICQCGNTAAAVITTASQCSTPCVGDKNSTCGSSNSVDAYDLSLVEDKSGKIVATPDSKGYMGCFVNKQGPVLDTLILDSGKMTNPLCAASCKELGYSLAGTFSSRKCYCGNSLNSTTADYRVLDSNCNSACIGDSKTQCGGPYHLNLYDVATYSTATNVTSPVLAEGAKGCFAPGTQANAPYKYSVGAMTTSLCRRMCRTKGFSVAALSNGNTCSCSSTPLYGPQQPSSLCTSTCIGNSAETCGSSTYFNIYDTTGAGSLPPAGSPSGYVGCVGAKDSNGATTLNGATITSAAMTPGLCSSLCQNRGFPVSGTGLVSGSTCSCGTQYPPSFYSDALCSWSCSGDKAQKCGNSYLFSLYDSRTQGGNSVSAESISRQSNQSWSSSSSASSSSSRSSSVQSSISSGSSKSMSSTSSVISLASGSASRSSSLGSTSGSAKSSSTSSGSVSQSSSSVLPSKSAGSSGVSSGSVRASASASSSSKSSISSSSVRASSSSSASASRSSSSSSSSSSAKPSSASAVISAASSKAASSSSSASSTSKAASSSSSASATSKAASSSSSTSSTSAQSPGSSASVDPSYVACYTLPDSFVWPTTTNATAMSPTKLNSAACRKYCEHRAFTYAAISNGTQCGCTMDISKFIINETGCTTPCPDFPNTMCGGLKTSSVWKSVVQPAKRHWRDFRAR